MRVPLYLNKTKHNQKTRNYVNKNQMNRYTKSYKSYRRLPNLQNWKDKKYTTEEKLINIFVRS